MRDMKPSRRALLAGTAAAGAAVVGGAAWWVPRVRSAPLPPIPNPPKRAPVALLPALSAPTPLGPGRHAGINLAHQHRRGLGYGSAASKAQLQALRTLGVTHVALTNFGYVGSVGDVNIRWGDRLDPTLRDEDLLAEARAAKALGLEVTLKPHIWSPAFWSSGKSRQDMRPRDGQGGWAAWFEAYTAFATHYAALAEEMGASLYVVGLEYLRATVECPGAWADVAAACRKVYGGRLTYAANWWREAELFADWSAFDVIGVNAYDPLSKARAPDAEALQAGWQEPLARYGALAAHTGKSVLFTEAGLPALRGAAARPWDAGLRGEADPALQAAAYEALLATTTPQPWFAGVYWWKWFTDGSEHADATYPPNAPARRVLGRWWAPT
jgi:hypothetical protein